MQTNSLSAERVFTQISNLQHGSASRPQLIANGVSGHTIDRRLSSGLWIPVAPAVFRSAARPPDWKMLTAAAVLEGHAEAVVAGFSALALLGVPVEPALVAMPRLLVPHMKTHESPVACVSQVRGWPEDDIVELPLEVPPGLGGLTPFRSTNVARSLIDIGCWARGSDDMKAFGRVLDAAIAQRSVALDDVIAAGERAIQLRRRGARRTVNWLSAREVAAVDISALERLARRKFKRWGVAHLIEFEVSHPAFPGMLKRADAVCRTTRTIFEFDSRLHHMTVAAFESDRARDARTVECGWRPVRLTWADFTTRSAATARLVRRLCGLDGASSHLPIPTSPDGTAA